MKNKPTKKPQPMKRKLATASSFATYDPAKAAAKVARTKPVKTKPNTGNLAGLADHVMGPAFGTPAPSKKRK